MYFWINDPLNYSEKNRKISVDGFSKLINPFNSDGYLCYVCDNPLSSSPVLQTIHFDESSQIELLAQDKIFSKMKIDFSDTEVITFVNNDTVSSALTDIKIDNMAIFNNDKDKKVYVRTSIICEPEFTVSARSKLLLKFCTLKGA